MTQIFNEQGQQVPVTVIEAEPNPVTKVVDKTAAGFAAVESGPTRYDWIGYAKGEVPE